MQHTQYYQPEPQKRPTATAQGNNTYNHTSSAYTSPEGKFLSDGRNERPFISHGQGRHL